MPRARLRVTMLADSSWMWSHWWISVCCRRWRHSATSLWIQGRNSRLNESLSHPQAVVFATSPNGVAGDSVVFVAFGTLSQWNSVFGRQWQISISNSVFIKGNSRPIKSNNNLIIFFHVESITVFLKRVVEWVLSIPCRILKTWRHFVKATVRTKNESTSHIGRWFQFTHHHQTTKTQTKLKQDTKIIMNTITQQQLQQ